MTKNINLEVMLVPADTDPPVADEAYQEELKQFEEALEPLGGRPSLLLMFAEGGSTRYLGDFYLPLKHGLTSAIPVIVAWIHGRSGRKVRLKVGDTEVEACTAKEVEALMEKAQKYKRDTEPKRTDL